MYCWWEYKKVLVTFGKQFVSFLKCSHKFIIGPSNSTPKRNENIHIYMKTCTQMFLAALFIIAQNWKQPKCPLTCEQLDKV